jgi:WS/DGAT/MGAT family acyltransferase
VTDRDRLSALDGAFLDLDTAAAPLNVGWTIRIDGPAPGLAALRRHLDGRLHRVPRFRQRVVAPPLAGGERLWADDPAFDIARHVHAVTLPAPGGPAEVRAVAGTLLSAALDPARPLWRLALVDGLAGRAWAIIGQAHHALIDGMAAMEVAALLLDAEPSPPPDAPRAPWRPAPPPPPGAQLARLTAGTVRRAAVQAAKGPGQALRAAGHAGASGEALTAALRDAAGALDTIMRPAPRTALDRTASRTRAVAFAEVGLDAIKEAGRRHGVTVNDVLLAACSMALGPALRRRGERPDVLKAMIPVDVRTGDGQELGNAISFVFVDLPIQEGHPARVLDAIHGQTAEAKAAGHATPLATLTRGADALPAPGRRAVMRLAARAAPFNVVISNVHGPQIPLYMLGRRVQAMFPAVPFLHGHALSIGALSYDGRVGVTLYADAEVVPDALDLARDVEAALDRLRLPPEARPPGPPTPWRRRASARRSAQRAAIR